MNEAVPWDAPMATSLVTASKLPNLPASLRTPSDRKVALWPTVCSQSRGFSADAAHENSRGCGQTFQTAEDERRCRLSRPSADTFICLRPFTCWRPAGVRWCSDTTGTRRGPGARRHRVPGAGHCEDWPTGPEGTGRGMPNSLWGCANLRLAIAAELWRESRWHVERHGGCRAGVAGG